MATAQTLHFNSLPQTVRQRLVEAMNRDDGPDLLLADRKSRGGALFGWSLLALLALGGIGLVAFAEFGSLWSGGVQETPFMAAYAGLLFVFFFAVLRAIRTVRLHAALPYRPGRYLFSLDCVTATSGRLQVTPMRELKDFKGTHHHTNGVYTHTAFVFRFEGGRTEQFTVKGKERAEAVLQRLSTLQQAIAQAVQNEEYEVVAALDPFFEVRAHDSWEQASAAPDPGVEVEPPAAREVGGLAGRAFITAVVLGLVLGPAAFLARNAASDEAMFASARSWDDADEYRRYLWSGTRHAEEVSQVLLPAAAFREAQQAESVKALREFLEEFPDSAPAPEARTAIHERYLDALAQFRQRATEADPDALAFMERLLAYLEEHETPDVTVWFQVPSAEALAQLDAQIRLEAAESEEIPEEVAPVAPHFTESQNSPREKEITRQLDEAFSQVIANDVLQLVHGGRMETMEREPVSSPTLEVAYRVEPSGDWYFGEASTRAFVGIVVRFHVAMRLPGDQEDLEFPLEVLPPDEFTVSYSQSAFGGAPMDGPADSLVYREMAARAFQSLADRLRATFFGE